MNTRSRPSYSVTQASASPRAFTISGCVGRTCERARQRRKQQWMRTSPPHLQFEAVVHVVRRRRVIPEGGHNSAARAAHAQLGHSRRLAQPTRQKHALQTQALVGHASCEGMLAVGECAAVQPCFDAQTKSVRLRCWYVCHTLVAPAVVVLPGLVLRCHHRCSGGQTGAHAGRAGTPWPRRRCRRRRRRGGLGRTSVGGWRWRWRRRGFCSSRGRRRRWRRRRCGRGCSSSRALGYSCSCRCGTVGRAALAEPRHGVVALQLRHESCPGVRHRRRRLGGCHFTALLLSTAWRWRRRRWRGRRGVGSGRQLGECRRQQRHRGHLLLRRRQRRLRRVQPGLRLRCRLQRRLRGGGVGSRAGI